MPRRVRDLGSAQVFDSAEALFAVDGDLRIVAWNPAVEGLTGIPAVEAIGRPCWEVVRGVDARGRAVCCPSCSYARRLQQGHLFETFEMLVAAHSGRRRVCLSTVGIRGGRRPSFLHLMSEVGTAESARAGHGEPGLLTPRQQRVLELLDQGLRVAGIAHRLGIAETTVRNHVRAILSRLSCHSQLEAVAEAHRRGLIDEAHAASSPPGGR